MATTITVHDMSCEGCEDIVENALAEVDGAESAEADRESGTATVEGDADADDLVEAASFAGYEAEAGAGGDEAGNDGDGNDGDGDGPEAGEETEE